MFCCAASWLKKKRKICVLKTRNKTILFVILGGILFGFGTFWLLLFYSNERSIRNFMFWIKKRSTRKQRLDVFVCVWTIVCTKQRKPRETDTNKGVEMNKVTADVEKLRKIGRDFWVILVGRGAHLVGCLFMLVDVWFVFNLLLSRVLGRLLALIISVFCLSSFAFSIYLPFKFIPLLIIINRFSCFLWFSFFSL